LLFSSLFSSSCHIHYLPLVAFVLAVVVVFVSVAAIAFDLAPASGRTVILNDNGWRLSQLTDMPFRVERF
jgi:hypothetical protein